jgi:hypothetical protein
MDHHALTEAGTGETSAAARGRELPRLWGGFAMLQSVSGIRTGWGRNDMANRLRFFAVFFFATFSVSGLTAAHAADPGFCKQYSQAALNQVRGGLSNPACAGGMQGARWSTDFAVHYEWCLGASFGAAGGERDARTHYLRGCTGH